uniref:Uncharacterized protein n=1 Tax=Eptatretus burgeri TaxID=7764 RepID=A0A8C4ND17_EPTBU
MKRQLDEEENVTTTTQQQPPGIAPGGDSFPRLQNGVLAPAPVCEPMPENIDPSAGIQSYSRPTTDQVPPIAQGTLGLPSSAQFGPKVGESHSCFSSPAPVSMNEQKFPSETWVHGLIKASATFTAAG